MSFTLQPLPYAFDALESAIDSQTVEIHYTKHHATYLNNLNTALEKHPDLFGWQIERVLSSLDQVPEEIRTTVRNNGGGFFNHNLYWSLMARSPKLEPSGKLADSITSTFGSLAQFKQEFEKAGLGRFGSGWAWLSKKPDGSLIIHSTPNQDTPLAENLFPVIGIDVWEHAYYLRYQNRRAEYLSNWWKVLNWEEAERRYSEK
jgi:Fe-Mn family superoxide dismutase